VKIGRERTPLAERLSEQAQTQPKPQTENQADQAADLMRLNLEAFENDCRKSLRNAQTIIEGDIQSLLSASEQMVKSMKPIYLTAALFSLTVILMSFVASWYWATNMIETSQRANLLQMGLTVNQTDNGLVLNWDKDRIRLIDCRIGNVSAKCLQILERE
jgi:hypothetical protein